MTQPPPSTDDVDDRQDAGDESTWMTVGRHSVRLVIFAVVIFLVIHFAFPALSGAQKSLDAVRDANVWWIGVAVVCSLLTQAMYIVVFRYSVGGTEGEAERKLGWRQSYEVTMASQAASTLITAAGAGGIALFLWVLARAGFSKTESVARTIAFLAFHYVIYLGALVLFGFGLYFGILPGSAPTSLTLIPALVCLGLMALVALAARSPAMVELRVQRASARETRAGKLARRLLTVPAAIAEGGRHSKRVIEHSHHGVRVMGAAVMYWVFNIAILVACFEAFDTHATIPSLVQAFFIGSVANLLPLLPGGVGSVEAGLIAALVAFGEPGPQTVVAVLAYRLVGYWLPTIPQAVAYFQLNRTLAAWKEEREASGQDDDGEPSPASA
ncbi:MAG: YbhN family protein [Patulibacter minatonensis]